MRKIDMRTGGEWGHWYARPGGAVFPSRHCHVVNRSEMKISCWLSLFKNGPLCVDT